MASPATMDDNNTRIQPINKLQSGAQLDAKLTSLKRSRQNMEAQWKLNMAFYKGKQYTYFNKSTRRIESLPVEDGEKPRYRVRIVSNQIVSGTQSLLAKFTKTKPVITATPGSGSDSDLKAAQMAEQLLQHFWREFSLDSKLEEAILWSLIAGQGYWKVSWDADAGKAMRFMIDPQGKPITDESLKDVFRAQLQTQGIQPQEKVVYLGDIKVEAISPFDIYLDDTVVNWEEAKYAICVHYMTPEDIKAEFKVDVKADAVASAPEVALPFDNDSNRSEANVKAVNVGYFLPQKTLPNGRVVYWIDEKIVRDDPWTYPSNSLPFVKFPGVRVPGLLYDSSVVEQAIPLQKELNRTLSQIVEYKNLTIKPRVWAPVGSLDGQRLTSEPGAVYEYNPVGDHRPEIEKLPSMPPYVFDHLTGIRNGLREIFGLTEVTEGTVPPNVEAGIAIDLLQEMATDRLAPTIKLIETSLAKAGQLMLEFAQEYYKEPRLMKIQGNSGRTQVKRFTQADIQGGLTVTVETGSALPRTRAGRQARIMEYVKEGVIPPDKAHKYLDIADLEGLSAGFRADEDQALREHERVMEGKPINEAAFQQAMQELQSGQAKDEQGQPITDPQAAQAYVQKAGSAPLTYENYQAHMDTHALWMKSVEFESLPPEIKAVLVDHYTQTMQALSSIPPQVQPEAVRTSLQLKGTLGPTAAADILNKAGVTDITPEIMSEPPLETWISDSVDKPDADAAGPGQEANELSMAAQTMLAATAADTAAKQAAVQKQQQHDQGIDKGNQDQVSKLQSTAHAEEMHQAKMAQEGLKVALAEKKLKESSFKPAPKAPARKGK